MKHCIVFVTCLLGACTNDATQETSTLSATLEERRSALETCIATRSVCEQTTVTRGCDYLLPVAPREEVSVAGVFGDQMMTPEEVIEKITDMGGYAAGGGEGSPGDPGPDGGGEGGGMPWLACEQWCSDVFCEEYCDDNGCITICRVYTYCCQPSV